MEAKTIKKRKNSIKKMGLIARDVNFEKSETPNTGIPFQLKT